MTYPRIAIKCHNRRCRHVVAETDGGVRLYVSERGYIERPHGPLTLHCLCGASITWHPRLDEGRILEGNAAVFAVEEAAMP